MKRIVSMLICLLVVLAPPASRAEADAGAALAWLGADAALLEETQEADGRLLRYETAAAEMTLAVDGEGQPLWLRAGALRTTAAATTREQAEAALLAVEPEALILRVETSEAGEAARVLFTGAQSAGWAAFDGGAVCACELTFGRFLQEGALTFAGASQTLLLLRPGAQLDGMDLDEDDGMLVYEGDAYLDGQEYEFEIDARTGRLLEWERD